MSRDIYQAIMIAASRGKGLRLTPDEIHDLAMDNAIETAASNRLTTEDFAALRKMLTIGTFGENLQIEGNNNE